MPETLLLTGDDPALAERLADALVGCGWTVSRPREAERGPTVVVAPPAWGEPRDRRRPRVVPPPPMAALVGDSPPMQRLYGLLNRVADVDSSVLIAGESGTGKELVARALHDRSRRQDRPFVALNCAALPEPLLESELFGHVKGAFTDARADRTGLLVDAAHGTVFLDEIGDMPLGLQAKLLRVLQDRRVRPVGGNRELPVHARIIAASHRDLDAEAAAGRFRADLLYRLDVIRLDLPPLRDRGADVLVLAQGFLEAFAAKLERPVRALSAVAARQLLAYPWPGNVRELQNCMERAVVLAEGPEVGIDDLPPKVLRARVVEPPPPESVDPEALLTLAAMERRHIERVLSACGGSRTRAADVLAIDRKTLYRKLEQYRSS